MYDSPLSNIILAAIIYITTLGGYSARAEQSVIDRFGNKIDIKRAQSNLESRLLFNGIQKDITVDNIRSIKAYPNADIIVLESHEPHDYDRCTVHVLATMAKNFYIDSNLGGNATCKSYGQNDAAFWADDYSGVHKQYYVIGLLSDVKREDKPLQPFFTAENMFMLLKEVYTVYILSDKCEDGVSGEQLRAKMKEFAVIFEAKIKQITNKDSETADLFERTAQELQQATQMSMSTSAGVCQSSLRQIGRFFEGQFVEIPISQDMPAKKPW